MALEIPNWDPHTPNEDIIRAIRHEASSDYQRRIPDAIKADVKATMRELSNYRPAWNEFVAALVNKIGLTIAHSSSWTNPLARYKRGFLEFGDTIEEYQTGLIQSYTFDPRRSYGEKALFGKHSLDVQSAYHTINRESVYPLTIQRSTLQRAFTTPDGLAQFITSVMEAPIKSDQWDEFLLMCQLFPEYEENGGFFKIHVDDLAGYDSTDAQARRGLRTLRELAETLPFISTHYNAAKMPVSADPEDIILITTPKFKSAMDINGLAAMFNVSYAEVPYRTHVIPEENFGIPGVQAVLTTKDFFVVADTYFDTAVQPNAAGRYENHFLHHDQIISASKFVPAIALTTGLGDTITIVDTPVTAVDDIVIRNSMGQPVTTLERGGSYLVDASAVTEGENDAVMLELIGNDSSRSYLAQTGTLHIALDEPQEVESVVIKATAEDDVTKTLSETFALTGDTVRLWGPNRLEEETP